MAWVVNLFTAVDPIEVSRVNGFGDFTSLHFGVFLYLTLSSKKSARLPFKSGKSTVPILNTITMLSEIIDLIHVPSLAELSVWAILLVSTNLLAFSSEP